MDCFTESFKFYKRQKTSLNFSAIIDLNSPHLFKDQLQLTNLCPGDTFNLIELGLVEEKWLVYSLINHEGCYLIKNPFVNGGHLQWLRKCLEIYPQTPNVNNLGINFDSVINPWHQLNETDEAIAKSKLSKLHWVTLGYHHNWDTKVYDLDKVSEFPLDLSRLVRCIAECLGFKDFHPEAAIINYYSTRSTIGGHTDHSEFDHTAPLISISFGLTGLFLLGGTTKDVKPSAMFLRSGDIMIMSGPSRLAYHGVPLVLSNDNVPDVQLPKEPGISSEDEKLNNYTKHFRININVRQVFTSEKVCPSLLSDQKDNSK